MSRHCRRFVVAWGALLTPAWERWLLLLLLGFARPSGAAPVGGGILDGGFLGEYFANPDFSGAPSFTRRDVRIDFHWQEQARPGGSSAPGFREVGTDGYSIRWTARFVPRFAEAYTFVVEADDGARLSLRRGTEATFPSIIDALDQPGLRTASVVLEGFLDVFSGSMTRNAKFSGHEVEHGCHVLD